MPLKSYIFWWHNLFIDTETLLFIRIFYQVISSVMLPIKQSESGFGHSKLSPRISYFFSEKFVISRGYETKNIMSDIIKLSEIIQILGQCFKDTFLASCVTMVGANVECNGNKAERNQLIVAHACTSSNGPWQRQLWPLSLSQS